MSERPLERWKRLRLEGAGDGVLEVPSFPSNVETGFGKVRFAIGPEGQPRLLVPVGSIHGTEELVSTSKLSVTMSRYSLDGRSIQFIDVVSIDRSLDPVFADLAEEILNRIEDGYPPVASVSGAIEDFRKLLRETRAEIPDSKILGLVGELHVLTIMTKLSKSAVDTWTGPYELRHDFRRTVIALEVKTSGRSDATRVSINGEDQLDAPSHGTLTLVHVRMEKAEDGELSVGKLAKVLLDAGTDRDILYRGLSALGCSNPDDAEWNRLSFCLEGVSAFTVTEGFPRITNTNFPGAHLPYGISKLKDDVDLTHAFEFKLTESEFEAILKRIVE